MQHKSPLRRRFTSTERTRLLAAYREGDLTQREFALRHQLSVSWLGVWLRQAKSANVPPALLELPGGLPRAGGSRAAYQIQFPGGPSLEVAEGFRPEELTQLCQILRGL